MMIGCYYLVKNMSLNKTDNENLDIFLNNLKNFMVNFHTNEDYVNDGNGVTFFKINTMLRQSWQDWKPLAFPHLKLKQNKGGPGDHDSAVTTTAIAPGAVEPTGRTRSEDFRATVSKDLAEYLINDDNSKDTDFQIMCI